MIDVSTQHFKVLEVLKEKDVFKGELFFFMEKSYMNLDLTTKNETINDTFMSMTSTIQVYGPRTSNTNFILTCT